MNYCEGKGTPVYLGNENVGDPEITDQCQERKKKNGMIDLKAYMRELVETLNTVFEKDYYMWDFKEAICVLRLQKKVILMLWLLLTK